MSKYFLQPCNQNPFPKRKKEADLTQWIQEQLCPLAQPPQQLEGTVRDTEIKCFDGVPCAASLAEEIPTWKEEMPGESSWIITSAYWEPLKTQQFVWGNILRPEGPMYWWQQAQGILNKINWRPQLVMLANNRALRPTGLPRNSFTIQKQISEVKGFKETWMEETQQCWKPKMLTQSLSGEAEEQQPKTQRPSSHLTPTNSHLPEGWSHAWIFGSSQQIHLEVVALHGV